MIELSEVEALGGQIVALRMAEKHLLQVPVKTREQTLQLVSIRAEIRKRKRQLKTEMDRVQLRL